MTRSSFSEATGRELPHAGCKHGGSFVRVHGQSICTGCQRELTDPSEILRHEPIEIPKVQPGYRAAVIEAWS
jgi:hypothetical protein